MTTADLVPPTRAAWRTAGLHLLGWPSLQCWPWLLVTASFAVNAFVISLTEGEARANYWTGGITTIYGGVFVTFLYAMTQWLSFALGLSVTRDRFYRSTALFAAGQSALFAAILVILLVVERVTDGWGLGLEFFGPAGLVVDNVAGQFLIYAVSLLAVSFWGMTWGLVHRCWGPRGLLVATLICLVAAAGIVVVLTRPDMWDRVRQWHIEAPVLVPLLGWPLAAGLVAAALSAVFIRRATP